MLFSLLLLRLVRFTNNEQAFIALAASAPAAKRSPVSTSVKRVYRFESTDTGAYWQSLSATVQVGGRLYFLDTLVEVAPAAAQNTLEISETELQRAFEILDAFHQRLRAAGLEVANG